MKPFVRSAYNYDMDAVSLETGLKCEDPTRTQQSFKDEVDINTIVERFHLTGTVPQLQALPNYADYEGIFDFQTAMNAIREADETFMSLPAKLRARFHNSPQEFLEFASDEANRPEAERLGLLKSAETTTMPAATPSTTGEPNGPAATASPTPQPERKT